ncbi:aldo-keto reductase [Klebsiella pneumoniae subsp. pneumoniae]|nr:aldo-keto reductase [Klebsiella pneumoniae]VTS52594.1 aldo-keto reductase [Klebsiella pneumoniae subsp. pneumoniae]
MSSVTLSGRGTLGDRQVYRLGYGAMQLAGPGVFGPPKDPEEAVRVLQAAVEAGINHIDTSDFYGPHVTNQLIRKALHPYPDDLCIVTKVSARRDEKGNWLPAMSPAELTQAVEDNLRHLGLYGSTTYCNFYSHVKYSPLASSVRVIYVAFCCYTAPDIQPFFD